MADTLIDNSFSNTQRVIDFSTTPQTFGTNPNAPDYSSYTLDATDRADVFRLNWSRSSGVVVKLATQIGNADLQLLDAGGEVLQSSSNTGTTADTIFVDRLEPGTYYIRIHNDAEGVFSRYSFTVESAISQADILWRNISPASPDVINWKMNGTTREATEFVNRVINTNWRLETTGDFDGDGIQDIVWRNISTGENRIWLMNSDNTIRVNAELLAVIVTDWRIVGAGDFTGDGQTDLLWRNQANGSNVIWEMNGISRVGVQPLAPNNGNNGFVPIEWEIQAVADFNRDGKPDIVWRNMTTGQNLIWEMDGVNFARRVDLVNSAGSNLVQTGWRIEGAGDFNGDGNVDILWRRPFDDGQNVIWLMNGAQQLDVVALPSVVNLNWEVGAVVPRTAIADIGANTLATAFNIGNFATANMTYSETVGKAGDPRDYYKFTLAAPSLVKVGLSGYTGQINLQLLHDRANNGTTEVLLNLTGNSAQVASILDEKVLEAIGTYYILVQTTNPAGTAYDLAIASTAANLVNLSTVANSFRVFNASGNTQITEVTLSPSGPTQIQVEARVRNNSGEALTNVLVEFYVSQDATITPTSISPIDTKIGETRVNIGPNSTVTVKVPVNLPASNNQVWSGDQTYFLGAYVNPPLTGGIPETNPNDNAISRSFVIKGTDTPDLVGSLFNVSTTSASPGTQIEITGAIRNQGRRTTSEGFFVQLILSKNDVIGDFDDLPLNAFIFYPEAIGPGESVAFSTNWTAATAPQPNNGYLVGTGITPPLQLPGLNEDYAAAYWQDFGNGTYYLGMVVDFVNISGEPFSNFGNNKNQGIGLDLRQITITGII